MEELCGGTLLKCVQRGDTVTVCHVCNGNMGHEVIMPDELRLIRYKEAQKSGATGGLRVVTLDIGDLRCDGGSLEQRDMIVEVIREAQPDFIITHDPNDYMTDHTAVSKLTFEASFVASVPHYKPGKFPASNVTPLYYMDTYAGINFVPTEYVDISDVMDIKLEMVKCHESQIKWLYDHDHIDYPETVKIGSKYRGLQCGVEYAEGFRQCLVAPKILPKRLLP